MKQLFYASLCDSYPNLAKDLRYALFQQKKELDERLEVITNRLKNLTVYLQYILENAKSIQEKQEEIYKLKSEIVQRTGHLAKNQVH